MISFVQSNARRILPRPAPPTPDNPGVRDTSTWQTPDQWQVTPSGLLP